MKLENLKNYIISYMEEAKKIIDSIDSQDIANMTQELIDLRQRNGRLFILGVGGGAGHASHAVNDFRKIAGIESYSPSDNVSELTARINDDGWDTAYENWLKGSRIDKNDMILVFSVGGGNEEKNVSVNLVNGLKLAKKIGAKVIGIVGRDGGFTARVADACVIVPTINEENITPQTEAFQAVVWHLLVSHPALRVNEMKWESVK